MLNARMNERMKGACNYLFTCASNQLKLVPMVRINSRNHVIENKPQTWTARQLKHHKDYQLQNQLTEKQQLLSTEH